MLDGLRNYFRQRFTKYEKLNDCENPKKPKKPVKWKTSREILRFGVHR
jgi:hypothetical protein